MVPPKPFPAGQLCVPATVYVDTVKGQGISIAQEGRLSGVDARGLGVEFRLMGGVGVGR
jgi:hypothetical protein